MAEIDEVDIDRLRSAVPPLDSPLTSRDLKPVEAKTDQAAIPVLEGLELPHPADRLDPVRVSKDPYKDPGLTIEALNASLLYEKKGIEQLQKREEETGKQLKIINQLLDLSGEIGKLKKDKYNFSELSKEMQQIVKDLKEQGI